MGQNDIEFRIGADISGLRAELARMRDELGRMGQSGQQAGRTAAGGLGTVQGSIAPLRGEFSALRQQIMQLGAAFASLEGVKAFIRITDEAKRLEGQLKLVVGSQAQLVQTRQQLLAQANANGVSMASTVELYTRIARATKNLDGSSEQLNLRLADVIGKFASIGGTGAEQVQSGLLQLGQALASSQVQWEEMAGVLDGTPAVFDAIVKGLGVTQSQLKQMGSQGKLSGADLVNALLKMGATADEQFAKLPRRNEQAMTALSNQFKALAAEMDVSFGASTSLIQAMDGVRPHLKEVVQLLKIVGTSVAFRYVALQIIDATKALAAKIVAMRAEQAATIQSTQLALAQARITEQQAILEKAAATAALDRARAEVAAAEMSVAAQRQLLQGEITRLEASRAVTLAERQLEAQRLQSQISAQGRAATMTRMAELQRIQAQQTREITALEGQLAATTVATSEAVVAAHTAQTAAVGRQAAATAGLTAAQAELAAASRAAAAAQTASLGVGRGLLAMLGGPMGLGVLVASVAAGWLLMRDNTDQARTSLEQIGTTTEEVTKKLSQLGIAQRQKLIADALAQARTQHRSLDDAKSNFASEVSGAVGLAKSQESRQALYAINRQFLDGLIDVNEALKKIKPLVDPLQFDRIRTSAAAVADQADVLREKARVLTNLAEAERQAAQPGSGGLPQVSAKTVVGKADPNTIAQQNLEALIAAEDEASAKRRANIAALGELKLQVLRKELDAAKSDAKAQGEIKAKIHQQELDNKAAVDAEDKALTDRANERAIALSDHKLELERLRLGRENEAAQSQFDQQKISVSDLQQTRMANMERMHRLEVANIDSKIQRTKATDRQSLVYQRQQLLERQKSEAAALTQDFYDQAAKFAEDVGKKNSDILDTLSDSARKLSQDGLSELDQQIAEVDASFKDAVTKIAELRKKLTTGDGKGVSVDIENPDGSRTTVTPDVMAAHEAELQAQIEQAKQQVRERYAEEQRLAQAKLAGQLAQLEGRELDAALAEIDAKWRDVLEQMRRDGDSAGIEIVAKIVIKEKAAAQAAEIQRTIQKIIERYQDGTGSLDRAAEGDWRTQLALGSAKQQLAQNAMTELQPLRDQLAQSRDQGVTGLDADIARVNATIEELAQVCPTAQARLGAFLSDLAQAGVESAESGLSNFFMDLVEGTKSGSQALKDFARSFVMSMAQVAAKALATFAILKLLDAIYPGLGQATAAMAGAGVHHDGGIAGQASTTRSVNPLLFAAAPRYHVGGIAGLRPGEVPAILQAGEEVLTRNDPRHVANGGVAGSPSIKRAINPAAFLAAPRYHVGGIAGLRPGEVPAILQAGEEVLTRNDPRHVANGGGSRSVRIINEFSPDATLNHMQSSAGEEVILNVIGRNAGSIRRLLG